MRAIVATDKNNKYTTGAAEVEFIKAKAKAGEAIDILAGVDNIINVPLRVAMKARTSSSPARRCRWAKPRGPPGRTTTPGAITGDSA